MLTGLENPLHILIIVLVLLLVFGAKRLPEMGRNLGKGMREFKHSISGDDAERNDAQELAPTAHADSDDASTAPTGSSSPGTSGSEAARVG